MTPSNDSEIKKVQEEKIARAETSFNRGGIVPGNNGGPAFPFVLEDTGNPIEYKRGMSLLAYFAAHAPEQSIALKFENTPGRQKDYLECLAKIRVDYAQAMIKELEGRG